MERDLITVAGPPRAPQIKILAGGRPRIAALAVRRDPTIARIPNAEAGHPAIIARNSISAPLVVDHAATTRDPAGFGGMIASEAALAAVMRIVGISAAVQEVLDHTATMRARAIQPGAATCVAVSAALGAVGPMAEARRAAMVCAVVSATVVAEAVRAEPPRAAMPPIAEVHPARIAMTGRSSMAIDAMKRTRAHLAQGHSVTAREDRAAHVPSVTGREGQAVHARLVTAREDRAAHARLRIVHSVQTSAHLLSVAKATGALTRGRRNRVEMKAEIGLLAGHSATGATRQRPKASIARVVAPPPEATPARPEARHLAGVASVGSRPVHHGAARPGADQVLPDALASASGATTNQTPEQCSGVSLRATQPASLSQFRREAAKAHWSPWRATGLRKKQSHPVVFRSRAQPGSRLGVRSR